MMVIVIVRWYIKEGHEKAFVAKWEQMKPAVKDGLFREFFSKPVDKIDEKYHSLDLESKHYSTFINVGVWRTLDDFDEAIGKMIPGRNRHPKEKEKEVIELFEFEFKLRERIVMDVDRSRGGAWVVPAADL